MACKETKCVVLDTGCVCKNFSSECIQKIQGNTAMAMNEMLNKITAINMKYTHENDSEDEKNK